MSTTSSLLLLCLSGLLRLAAGQDGLVCSPQKTFPHPDDCNRYYYCDNTNTPQVFYCSPGFHFNPDTGSCDRPDTEPCPFVPVAGQPSVASFPLGVQPSDPSLPGDEGLVVGQSYPSSLPDTREFYSPSPPDLGQPSAPEPLDLEQLSVPSLPDLGRSSVPSLVDLEQPSVPSLPDQGQSSVPPLVDLEQPSEASLSDGEEVPAEEPYFTSFPGRGGPVFRQPEAEDRQDNVGDIVYENKSDNSTESFGTIFKALEIFEKTLEEERKTEEDEVNSEFVDVKRQALPDDESVSPPLNFTDGPIVVSDDEEGKTEKAQNEETSEVIKTEARCSADSDFLGRKAPSETVDPPSDSEKAEEETVSEGDKENTTDTGIEIVNDDRENTEAIVWPLFPLTNLTLVNDESGADSSKALDFPTVKPIEVDTKNLTGEENPTFNYPMYTVLNVNETSPLQNTETGRVETVDEIKEGNEERIPEKAEEIEEAKGTIIFESHSEEEENDRAGLPEDGLTKVVIKETAIL